MVTFERRSVEGESCFVWPGILFEEPNPTGSRPSVLMGGHSVSKIPRGDINGVGKMK